MAQPKEYRIEDIYSYQTLTNMKKAVQALRDEGFESDTTVEKISVCLSGFSTVLGLCFGLPTPLAVASAFMGVIGSLGSTQISNLKHIIYEGYLGLDELAMFMQDNPEYDRIKAIVSFIEYPDEGIRFATYIDKDYITAVHTSGGWKLENR